jgi:hypothetical protein
MELFRKIGNPDHAYGLSGGLSEVFTASSLIT